LLPFDTGVTQIKFLNGCIGPDHFQQFINHFSCLHTEKFHQTAKLSTHSYEVTFLYARFSSLDKKNNTREINLTPFYVITVNITAIFMAYYGVYGKGKTSLKAT